MNAEAKASGLSFCDEVDIFQPTPEQLGETIKDKDCFLYVVSRVEKCLNELSDENTIIRGVTLKSSPLMLQAFCVFFNDTVDIDDKYQPDLIIDVYNAMKLSGLSICVSKGNFPPHQKENRNEMMVASDVRSIQNFTLAAEGAQDEVFHVSDVDTYLIRMKDFVRTATYVGP